MSPTAYSRYYRFEPEITAKIAKHNWRTYEVPITYAGRTYEEGKKITWKDSLGQHGRIAWPPWAQFARNLATTLEKCHMPGACPPLPPAHDLTSDFLHARALLSHGRCHQHHCITFDGDSSNLVICVCA